MTLSQETFHTMSRDLNSSFLGGSFLTEEEKSEGGGDPASSQDDEGKMSLPLSGVK